MSTITLNEIYNLDCLELFKRMKASGQMVDAIITDPPYNISRPNNFNTIGRSGIDFGKWDKGADLTEWIKEAVPLVKAGGTIIIFNDWKNLGLIAQALELAGCDIKDLIRWRKTNPMPRNIARRYITDFELAIWATKGDNWTFNWDKQREREREENWKQALYLRPEYVGAVVLGKERIHPTQKNLSVIKGMVETHTNKGDVVLDPFIGSGILAKACQELGRQFIGSEINPDYFEKAQKRINKKTS